MSESSSEQQFRKRDTITIAMLNFWSLTPSATQSYVRLAGWLAGWLARWMAGWLAGLQTQSMRFLIFSKFFMD